MKKCKCVLCGGTYDAREFSSTKQRNNSITTKHSYCGDCHRKYNKANSIERALTNPELRLKLKEAKRCCKQMRMTKIVIHSNTSFTKEMKCSCCNTRRTITVDTQFVKGVETVDVNFIRFTRNKEVA